MGFAFMVTKEKQNYYNNDGFFTKVDPVNPRDIWFFSALESGVKDSINIDVDEKSGALMAYVNVIMGPTSTPVGVAGCGITLDDLSKQLAETRLTENSMTYLIGKNGTIKAHPDTEAVKSGLKIQDSTDKEFKSLIVPKILSMERGEIEYTSSTGKKMLVSYTTIPASGWKVIMEIPKEELGEGLSRIVYTTVGIVTGSLFILIIVLSFLLNVILRPIGETSATLRDIAEGEGDLTKRLPVTSHDEIGEMAGWFNTFMEKLQGIIGEISQNAQLLGKSSIGLSHISGNLSTSRECWPEFGCGR